MVRLDSRTGLARLAEDTGGFLVEESNDLDARLPAHRRGQPVPLHADLRAAQHGVRRQVPRDSGEVAALRHPGVRAQGVSRALACASSIHTASYEVPALAMLDRTPLPNAFPIRPRASASPTRTHPGLTPLVVRLSTDSLRFVVDADESTYQRKWRLSSASRTAKAKTYTSESAVRPVRRREGHGGGASGARSSSTASRCWPPACTRSNRLCSMPWPAMAAPGSPPSPCHPLNLKRSGMSSLVFVDHVEQIDGAPPDHTERAAPFYIGADAGVPEHRRSRDEDDDDGPAVLLHDLPGR